jgi:riboflavin synthase
MFTGIIEGLGKVTSASRSTRGMRLSVEAPFSLENSRVGDSIAVNGACLTAVTLRDRHFSVDVSPETLSISTTGSLKPGDRVNLERALRLSDRLDGHLVSGHIDGIATIAKKQKDGNALIIAFAAPGRLTGGMIAKGSVAIDGISLTINGLTEDTFSVAIIPHTAGLSTLGAKKTGDRVNIETDMVGKYVYRFLEKRGTTGRAEGVDMDLLHRTGFL